MFILIGPVYVKRPERDLLVAGGRFFNRCRCTRKQWRIRPQCSPSAFELWDIDLARLHLLHLLGVLTFLGIYNELRSANVFYKKEWSTEPLHLEDWPRCQT